MVVSNLSDFELISDCLKGPVVTSEVYVHAKEKIVEYMDVVFATKPSKRLNVKDTFRLRPDVGGYIVHR